MPSLTESYEYCHELTQRTAHNFRFSFLTLPPDKRRAMDALYAFNRITDDLGDEEDVAIELRRTRLAAWRESLRFVLNIRAVHEQHSVPGTSESPNSDGLKPVLRTHNADKNGSPGTDVIGTFSDHPAHAAIADMVAQYKIPHEYLFAVIDGVEMDLYPSEFAAFDDLQRYCYHVAGAVGLCCIHIWGFRDEKAIPLASDCGLALQLTNILRDIGEDSDVGRIYLPGEDLKRFGYSPDDLRNHVMNDQFLSLMRFQTERAKAYYGKAEQLFAYLEPPGKPILRAMIDIYGGLLREIERRNFDVYSKRVSLPKWKKLWYATRAMIFSR
ncbi:MAG: phytoene/squalene synthase family protein [Schlesneria sp.]